MKRLKRFIGYCLIIGSTTVGLAMLTGHGYFYKGIKEVWLRGWSSGNIDDLQFAYDTRVLKASDPLLWACLLYTSPSPRDLSTSRMPSSA